jgi:hypothetical protein
MRFMMIMIPTKLEDADWMPTAEAVAADGQVQRGTLRGGRAIADVACAG